METMKRGESKYDLREREIIENYVSFVFSLVDNPANPIQVPWSHDSEYYVASKENATILKSDKIILGKIPLNGVELSITKIGEPGIDILDHEDDDGMQIIIGTSLFLNNQQIISTSFVCYEGGAMDITIDVGDPNWSDGTIVDFETEKEKIDVLEYVYQSTKELIDIGELQVKEKITSV